MRFRNDQERLVAEQAVLAYRATVQAADDAEFGHGMEAIEDVALKSSREHGRRLIELAMKQMAAQKRKSSAPVAGDARTSNAEARDR